MPIISCASRWIRMAVLALCPVAPLSAAPVFGDIAPLADGYFDTPAESDFWTSSVAAADVDGDGDQDLAVLGFFVVYNATVEERLVILRNDGFSAAGRWLYTALPVPLGGLSSRNSDLAWGDYDGDGDHDLVVGTDRQTRLYRNDGGNLSDTGLAFPGYLEESSYSGAYDLRSITWVDADNDGDLDLFLPTTDRVAGLPLESVLMRNDGDSASGWQFVATTAGLDAGMHAQSAWIDNDGDGDLDLLMADADPLFDSGSVRRFRNDGGSFVAAPLLNIAIQYGLADWADVDADGRLDMLLAGNILDDDGQYRTVLRTYRGQAGGGYAATDLPEPAAPWLDVHAATWADYDSDGDVDLLATGSYVGGGKIEGRSLIYGNDGSGQLAALNVQLPAPQSSIGRGGAFTWFDIDNDGDLDYLVAGGYPVAGGNGLVEARMQLFRNETTAANAAPGAPGTPLAQVTGNNLSWSWTAAIDDHTAAAALTYELELHLVGQAQSTVRRLSEPGRIGATLTWSVTGLVPGSYQWRLRAVDTAWHAGTVATGLVQVPGSGDALFGSGFER